MKLSSVCLLTSGSGERTELGGECLRHLLRTRLTSCETANTETAGSTYSTVVLMVECSTVVQRGVGTFRRKGRCDYDVHYYCTVRATINIDTVVTRAARDKLHVIVPFAVAVQDVVHH